MQPKQTLNAFYPPSSLISASTQPSFATCTKRLLLVRHLGETSLLGSRGFVGKGIRQKHLGGNSLEDF